MLDVMRKHSRSFLIYVFFGIIIAVFVINFGPQSAGCVTSGTSYAGTVTGQRISIADFEYAQSVLGLRQRQGSEQQLVQLRKMVMDRLIARELLAKRALDMGYKIPIKEIRDMIFSGRYLALGQPRPLIRGEDGAFDYSRFSRYVRYYWGLNVKRFQDQQRRELLADKMRKYLETVVRVSEDEVKTDWVFRNTKVKLAYVRFSPGDYKSNAGDASALADWKTKNKARIAAYYKANKSSFSKLPEQLLLRVIELKFKSGDKKAQAAAKKKAAALLAKLKAGGDFAKIASESSEHESKSKGGLVGWRNASDPGIGKEASKAVAKLKKDQLSALVAETDRFVIARVDGKRKGDLTLAQAEDEIARKLFAESGAKGQAMAEAKKYLARATAGEKLSEIFTYDGTLDEGDDDKKKKAAGDKSDGDDSKAQKSDKKVQTTNLFTRNAAGLIPRLGISKPLSDEVFKLGAGSVVPHVVSIGKLLYIVKVIERKNADLGEWTKRRDDLVEAFANRKQAEFVRKYTYDLCKAAEKKKLISIESSVFFTRGYLAGQRKAGKKVTMPAYEPCKTIEPRPMPLF